MPGPTLTTGVLINDFDSLVPSQSTAAMLAELARRGVKTWVFGVGDMGIDEGGRVVARARAPRGRATRPAAVVSSLRDAPAREIVVDELNGVLVRTNPPRDPRSSLHLVALQLLRFARDRGVVVLNDPGGLALAASKLYLALLPGFARPRTIASADPARLRDFVQGIDGPSVLKPAVGTRGRGVFRVGPRDPNLNQIIEGLVEGGPVIAQEFVPAADQGDTRVILVGGELLSIDGEPAAVHRVPTGDDFRSNIHAGGVAKPGVVSPEMERVIANIGPQLARHGLFLVGLDFIGDVVCEINVHSAGGFPDFERFTGKPFLKVLIDMVLDAFEHRSRLRVLRTGT